MILLVLQINLTIEWDEARNTVILGTNPEGTDFIEKFTPYEYSGYNFRKASDGESISLAGDNDTLIKTIEIKGMALPVTYTVISPTYNNSPSKATPICSTFLT